MSLLVFAIKQSMKDLGPGIHLRASLLPRYFLLQDPQYVSFGEKQEFLAIFFDIHAGIFGKEDSVAHFDFERYASAVIEHFAGADSNDFAFLRFFLCCIWQQDAAFGLRFFGIYFNKNTIC